MTSILSPLWKTKVYPLRVRVVYSRFFSSRPMKKFDGLVVGCYEDSTFTEEGHKLDQSNQNYLSSCWKASNKKGKEGEIVNLFIKQQEELKRVAIVGLGARESKNKDDAREIIRNAAANGAKALKANGAQSIGIDSLGDWKAAAEGVTLGLYKYDSLFTKSDSKDTPSEFFPYSSSEISAEKHNEWEKGIKVGSAQNLARRLAETPANLMTPSIFCSQATEVLKSHQNPNITIKVHDKTWAEQQKMGLLLGVSQGSEEPLRFLEIHYDGSNNKDDQPVVLVGKGITFDSGGISIKPSSGMATMKGDMTGAASVVAAISGIAAMKLPIRVVGLTPLCENLPSGKATKPGDVHFSAKGLSVEVDNTDAEGRLVLADALHYAHSFNPRTIINIATLTGAIDVALGSGASGVFTPDDGLWNEMNQAGLASGEILWRMPLFPSYLKSMKSNVADLRNASSSRSGGACTAAAFLKEFVSVQRWMHMDIAGTMISSESTGYLPKGMTGVPVRALIEFLSNQK